MAVRQLNMKNRTHYFYNDLINALNFEPVNLKLDKKTWKDIKENRWKRIISRFVGILKKIIKEGKDSKKIR